MRDAVEERAVKTLGGLDDFSPFEGFKEIAEVIKEEDLDEFVDEFL